MSRFGYYCRKTRRHLIGNLPDWNCNCGEPNGICIHSVNKFDRKGMSHAGVRTAISSKSAGMNFNKTSGTVR